ncbi:choice-of-anchor I family protein [Egicoccus halophilus]|uniref:choice-of-anchor I family protein n=1 Tax=Egicoccus halophilus TaxID=1670830 RepID=UPI00103163BC|nr:choice-of-anchor I family protein [Egicoccus halophilus]
MRTSFLVGAALAAAVSTASAALAAPTAPGPVGARPVGIELSVLGTYETGVFDASAAEIVAHDPATQRLFVVNATAGTVEVLDVAEPSRPRKVGDLVTAGVRAADGSRVDVRGVANSVAVRSGTIAVAVEAADKTDDGWVVFFDRALQAVNAVRVGALPDMLTFTPDGRTLLVANEGEPNDAYTVDPEGSVSLVPVGNPLRVTQDDVRTATFHAWDEDGDRTLHPEVRVFGPDVHGDRYVSRNLEPEYVVADARSRTAYVMLQEANAVAVLDVRAGRFTDIRPLGTKDHLAVGNELDVSDRDDAVNVANWPVRGLYQPDGFDSYLWRGQTLLVTANEGDAREWSGYSEVSRFRAWTADLPAACPGSPVAAFLAADNGIDTVAQLRDNAALGRLNVTTTLGRGEDGCLEAAHAFGARSFSIWTADGEQLYDSGADFERITAATFPSYFNSNHREHSFESRSDDKGPEPEDVVVGRVDGRDYAFVGLERIGGVMVYDVTDPRAPQFVQYLDNRDFSAEPGTSAAGDLGAEGLLFVAGKDSPTGRPMLVVANEVSGTTTLFSIERTTPGKGPTR